MTARVGAHVLSGSRATWEEKGGLAGKYSATSQYSGTAVGGMVGLEWEYFFASRSGTAPGMFLMAGYRYQSFGRVSFKSRDSSGVKASGDWRNADESRVVVDMSGLDLRLGLELAIPMMR